MTEQSLQTITPHETAIATGGLMSVIERIATDPNADISKLEKMLDMQERILKRDSEQAFSAAFARMQAEIPTVIERGEIKVEKTVRSKYATFEDIVDATRPVLTKYGFGINFKINQEEARIRVTATLRHELGHSESTDFVCSADSSGSKNNVQAIGSTISYGKRYALCALLNIATRGEDNDAQSANTISIEQAADIDVLIGKVGADKSKFLEYMGVKDVREISLKDLQKAKAALNAKARDNQKKEATQ